MVIEKPNKLLSMSPVMDFLNCYPNKKTRANYQAALSRYIGFVTGNPSPDCEELDCLAFSYLMKVLIGEQNIVHDLKRFSGYLEGRFSPSYRNLILSITSIWLDDCDVEVSSRQYRRIMPRATATCSIREEVEMSREMFLDFYNTMPRWCATLLVVLIGTGMRIGEALSIFKSDISWEDVRPVINIRAEITKTKEARKVLLTAEAADELRKYLISRTDNDPRVFPHRLETAQHNMRTAADKLGYGENRLRSVHWHMTRKWFLSQFSLAASKDVGEELAGHKGYLSKSYRRFSRQEILKEFLKAEPYLSILPRKNTTGKKEMLVKHVAVNDNKIGDVFDSLEGNRNGLILYLEPGSIKGWIWADNQALELTRWCVKGDVLNLSDNLTVGAHDTFSTDIVGKLFTLHK